VSPKLILCGGLPLPRRASPDTVELDTNLKAPAPNRVFLRLDTLTARLVDNLEPVLADAVEVAAYVFTADRLMKRGSDQMSRMGADWRRSFRFKIPVRRLDIWRQKEVSEVLIDALSFLSDDEFTFEFEEGNYSCEQEPSALSGIAGARNSQDIKWLYLPYR